MKTSKIVFTLIFLCFVSLLPAQDAEALLKSVGQNMDKIQRFEADALIKVDVDFIDIKDRKMKVRFESPDKFTFDVEGLALLPKKGMQMDYLQLLKAKYTAIEVGQEVIGKINTRIIKVIPEAEDSDVILAQLWIDPEYYRIMRMKTYTRKSGSYVIDFEYNTTYRPLPDLLTVSFEINNMTFPSKAMNQIMTEGLQMPDSVPKKATVSVRYSNYKIVTR
jgi:outer membrane lipoprotein-sorting protein